MKLYILRHATAWPRGATEYTLDSERPLTEEGVEEARAAATALKRLKKQPELIITSPFVRARQTAEQAAAILGPGLEIQEMPELQPEAKPADTSKAVQAMAARCKEILLVGHEPHVSAWIGYLISAGTGEVQCQMKKGGMASVAVEQKILSRGSGTLTWLLTPKQLALIGKKAGRAS